MNTDFMHVLGYINEVNDQFENLLEGTIIGPLLPLYKDLDDIGKNIDNDLLTENLEDIKKLMELELISIDINKKI